jgi:cytoskeleton protein RodZ
MAASQNTESATPPEYTDLPVGEILRRTRVHYNQSLEDVAGFMRIRASQLEAIEQGNIDQLPGRVYAIGYVRTYSEYLGLDGEKMVQLFKQQSIGKTPRPELHFPVAASESKAPNFFVIFASLAALVLVVGIWVTMNATGGKDDTAIAEIPNVPSNMRVADVMGAENAPATAAATATATTPAVALGPDGQPLPEDMSQPAAPVQAETAPQSAASATPATTAETAATPAEAAVTAAPAAPAVQPRQIVINVKERSWVEVRDKQGKAILSRILKPGEIFIVPEENYGLRLDTGNAGGLELVVNGQTIPPLGKVGDILRGMVLDGDQLLQKVKPAASETPAQ